MLSQKNLSEVVNQYFYLFFLFILKSEIFDIYKNVGSDGSKKKTETKLNELENKKKTNNKNKAINYLMFNQRLCFK